MKEILNILMLNTDHGRFFSEGRHPDKIANLLKQIDRRGWKWMDLSQVEMTREAYQHIPATSAAAQLFEP